MIKLLQSSNNLESISFFHHHLVVEPRSNDEQTASKPCSLSAPYFEKQMLWPEFRWKIYDYQGSADGFRPYTKTCFRAYLKWSLTTRLIKPSISRIYGLDFFPWYSVIEKSSLCIVKIIASIESETDENNGKRIEAVNSSLRAFKTHKNYPNEMHPTLSL